VNIAIIGRTEILYDTALLLKEHGHTIVLIITAKEAPEYIKTSSDFEKLADAWKIPFICTSKIENAFDLISSLPKVDVAVSVNFSGIIPYNIIDMFPLGILNAHGGDLPRYRGNACQAWAILNGESRIGLCIHKMIGGELDSGDIITRDYLPIDINTKITKIYKWMNDQVPAMFLDAVNLLSNDPDYVLETQSKNSEDSLRCYPRKPEDGKIEWCDSAENILRLINACNRPYSGAYCDFDGKKCIIWDAELAPQENFLAVPGQITSIKNDSIEVATALGKIKIKNIEIQGEIVNPSSVVSSIRSRFN
jgi:methionyl-tRNA formyltransferase